MTENSNLLLFLILVIIATRLASYLKRLGQPALLGELGCGILFALLGFYNIKFFQNLPSNTTLAFFSELGAIFLLFEIGLESNLSLLKQNGIYAITIAIVGAIFPFMMGYVFANYLVINSNQSFCLFFAATLAATSTGIAVRIFKDYNLLNSRACQIVLAASIMDDIISLITLSCITALVTTGALNLTALLLIPLKVIIFVLGLYWIIKLLLPYFFTPHKHNNQLDLALILFTCLSASWLAHAVGLSSVIGAFLGGLFLDKTYFKGKHYLVTPFIWLFVPIFFIFSGMQLDINSLFNLHTLSLALLLSLVAIITKVLPPLLIPHPSNWLNKLAIGLGMVPRGEIGLIIALIGKEIGVLNNEYFNIITLMVIITSVSAPILLNQVIKRLNHQA